MKLVLCFFAVLVLTLGLQAQDSGALYQWHMAELSRSHPRHFTPGTWEQGKMVQAANALRGYAAKGEAWASALLRGNDRGLKWCVSMVERWRAAGLGSAPIVYPSQRQPQGGGGGGYPTQIIQTADGIWQVSGPGGFQTIIRTGDGVYLAK